MIARCPWLAKSLSCRLWQLIREAEEADPEDEYSLYPPSIYDDRNFPGPPGLKL